jgi:hypothetical protein
MIRLPRYQLINGVHLELIKRTDKVALLSINEGRWYAVSRIYVWPKVYIENIRIPEREELSDSRQFTEDGSKTFRYEVKAEKYFDELNRLLESQQTNDINIGL